MEQVLEGCTQEQFIRKDKSGKTFTPLWLAKFGKNFCLWYILIILYYSLAYIQLVDGYYGNRSCMATQLPDKCKLVNVPQDARLVLKVKQRDW